MVGVTGKPAATESWSNHEKEGSGKLVASRSSGNSWNCSVGSRKWPHNFHMSPAVVPHMDKVYSIIRQIYDRRPTDDLNDLDDENNAFFGVYLLTCHSELQFIVVETT